MVKTYDPGAISVIIGGKIISGFSPDAMVKVERNEDMWTLKNGVDGEGTRSKSNNKSGKITITLMNSSASNDDLSAFALADEISNTGAVPALIKDNNGTSLYAAATAWVKKMPDAEMAKDPNNRVWILESDKIEMLVGGNI